MAVLAVLAVGWSPISNLHDPLSAAMRWAAPPSPSPIGLGGGLTYAIDRGLCAKLLPRVVDWHFNDCAVVENAVARAFRVWEVNHPSIRFVDESSRACAPPSDGSEEPLEAFGAAIAPAGGCVQPEILLRAPIGDEGFNESYHFDHTPDRQINVLAVTELAADPGVRKTDGRVAASGMQITRARISLNTLVLWRLEGRSCQPLDRGHASWHIMFIVGWALGTLCAAVGFGAIVRRAVSAPKRPPRQAQPILRLLWLGVLGTLVCAPPLFNSLIIVPCERGDDFEMAMVHEIGHALGLDHPHEAAKRALNFHLPLASPGAAAPGGCFDDATLLTSSDHSAESVLTTRDVRTRGYCLSADDVDGLRWLYPPACGQPLAQTTDADVICPTDRPPKTGTLRVAIAVSISLGASAVFAALATALIGVLARAAERRRAEAREREKAAANATIAAAEEAPPRLPAQAAAPAAADEAVPPPSASPEPRARALLRSFVQLFWRQEPEAPPMPARRLSRALVAAASSAAAAASATGTDAAERRPRAYVPNKQADTESLTSFGASTATSLARV